MLKVVIVDDEIIVRVGFQSCIHWEEYGCEVIATCESAKDAMALFRKEIPDIVFTDIMMPDVSGIELIKHIRDYYPKIQVIVLSCINEIEYVKKAIKLGAEDYILKLSFTKDSMIELLTKLKESRERECSHEGNREIYTEIQSFNREEAFRMIFSGNLSIPDYEALADKLGYIYNPFERYCMGCFLIDNFKIVKAAQDSDTYIMRYGLLNIIKEYFGKMPQFELAFIQDYEIMVIFRMEREQRFPEGVDNILKLLNEALKIHSNLTLSLGMNLDPCSRLEVTGAYGRAKELAKLRFFDGGASFHKDECSCEEVFVPKRSVQRRIQEEIYRQNDLETFALIDEWFISMLGFQTYEQILNVRRSVVETWVFISGYTLPESAEMTDYDDMCSMANFWEAETIEELKKCFKNAVKSILSYLQNNKTANTEIMQLLNYLERHVEENISLENAADRCALGKSQFCILFKKTTGETFVNYFNGMKMKKAFALLSSENLQVQEVANQIGIRDISYFSRIFKKYYNMSPSEVKKM